MGFYGFNCSDSGQHDHASTLSYIVKACKFRNLFTYGSVTFSIEPKLTTVVTRKQIILLGILSLINTFSRLRGQI